MVEACKRAAENRQAPNKTAAHRTAVRSDIQGQAAPRPEPTMHLHRKGRDHAIRRNRAPGDRRQGSLRVEIYYMLCWYVFPIQSIVAGRKQCKCFFLHRKHDGKPARNSGLQAIRRTITDVSTGYPPYCPQSARVRRTAVTRCSFATSPATRTAPGRRPRRCARRASAQCRPGR